MRRIDLPILDFCIEVLVVMIIVTVFFFCEEERISFVYSGNAMVVIRGLLVSAFSAAVECFAVWRSQSSVMNTYDTGGLGLWLLDCGMM